MNDSIQNFIDSKNIAILGVSDNPRKFGNSVFKELRYRGYNLFPVHPTLEKYDETEVYHDIDSLPFHVDAAVVCIKPEKVAPILDQLIDGNIKKIWFQQGADFSVYAEKAREKGLDVIERKCILMHAPPVTGIHKFHRFLAKVFGRI
ncbi:MAG: CoA-binding protein [Candidatus Zixiibacteriota bacterium]